MAASNEPKPMLTSEQMARWLSCQKRGIDNMTARGVLPAYRIGRIIRYDQREIRQRLQQFRRK